MNEVTVKTYEVRSDAEIARARLAADGILSYVSVDDEGGLNPGFYRDYGVRLVVDSDDLDDAYASLGIERITVPRPVAEAVARHAVWSYPNEACGVILFDHHGPVFACCLDNTRSSPSRFELDPQELHGAVRFAESHGWSIGAVFHSHPRSAPYPSQRDRAGGADPDWLHFIIGPVDGRGGELRAFRFDEETTVEVSVEVSP